MPTAKKKPAKKVPPSRRPAAGRPARAAGATRRGAPAAPPKPRWSEQYEKAVGEYGRAMHELHGRNWPEARRLFEELALRYAESPDLMDITDRARTYLRACSRHLDAPAPGGALDAFLLGVYHSNRGEYDEAIELFEKALPEAGEPDKVLYALAAARSQKGDRTGAIETLKQAIQRDDRNRVCALNDQDFDPIRDEPEFIDLVEPEQTSGAQA